MTDEEKRLQREREAAYKSAARPEYAGSHEKELSDAYDALTGRGEFSYDLGSDALYKHYRDDYVRRGRLAMRDSAGQAAALTGGYASSYAEGAGQQRYDEYLQQLGAIVPELYSIAYSRYQDEGDALRERHDLAEGLRDREYRAYTDALDDYNNAQQRVYEREQEELERARKERDSEYQRRQNEAAARAKYGDFGGYAALYGDETAERMKNYWIVSNPAAAFNMGLITAERYYALLPSAFSGADGGAKSGGARTGTYYPNTAPDGRDAALVQRELRNMGYNIAVDGAWGPRSQKAWDKIYGSGKAAASALGTAGGTRTGSGTVASSGAAKARR